MVKDIFPNEQLLVNYLKYKRIKAGLKTNLKLGQMEKWCLEDAFKFICHSIKTCVK
jgi:hypothetical protein